MASAITGSYRCRFIGNRSTTRTTTLALPGRVNAPGLEIAKTDDLASVVLNSGKSTGTLFGSKARFRSVYP